MVMWVFNSKGESIHHPFQALGHFLRLFSSFDWDKKAITAHGPADVDGFLNYPTTYLNIIIFFLILFSMKIFLDLSTEENVGNYFIPSSILSQYSVKPANDSANASASSDEKIEKVLEEEGEESVAVDTAAVDDVVADGMNALTVTVNGLAIDIPVEAQVQLSRPPPPVASFKPPYMLEMESVVYERGFLNIIDPIDGKTNLCNEIDETGFIAIVNAFQESYKLFQQLCDGMQGLYSRYATSNVEYG